MCTTPELASAGGSGRGHQARLGYVRVEFSRYNYVVYPALGENLAEGFFGFLARVSRSGSARDYFHVTTGANLRSLFSEDRVQDIPRRFRELTSNAHGRFIYLFFYDIDEFVELHYRSETDWDAVRFELSSEGGELRVVRNTSADGQFFEIARRHVGSLRAIALPSRIEPDTLSYLFTGGPAIMDVLRFCQVREAQRPAPSADMRLMVFDPAHIVEHSVEAIRYYARLMQVVDARETPRRMSSYEQRLRMQGILACLCKQLADNSSGCAGELNMTQLNRAFRRYVDFGRRKANLIDNLYNFLKHPISDHLEQQMMVYQDGDVRPDGRVWLEIVVPAANRAGEHVLLAQYFTERAEEQAQHSAWSAFFRNMLTQGTVPESASVRAWNTMTDALKYSKLAVGVFEVRAYHLVAQYTSNEITLRTFNQTLRDEREVLRGQVRSIRRVHGVATELGNIRKIFDWAKRLSDLKGVFDGDITSSDFTSVLDTLSDLADRGGYKALATRAIALKNMVDVISNSSDFVDRIDMEDYDAALGHGIAVGVGLVEVGYIVATGSALGGPVGAGVAIVGAIGAVIVLLATDSDMELFLNRCSWGNRPHESGLDPDWGDGTSAQWTDHTTGVIRQMNTCMNVLHKYEVAHHFDTVTRVVAIEVETKFLPDTARFRFKGEFRDARNRRVRVSFSLRFPARSRRRYRRFGVRERGPFSAVRGANVQVFTESGNHRILINLGVTSSVTAGEAWLQCYPFGHDEFVVPRVTTPQSKNAFHLEQLIQHDNIVFNRQRDYAFEPDEWGTMPSW